MSGGLSKVFPKLRAPSPVTKGNLSTDKETVETYFNDPLVFRSLTFKFGSEINTEQRFVNENIQNLKIPTLVLHGSGDKIVPIKASSKISQLENVKFIKVDNSKHEILNQDTRTFVLSEIHHWLREQKVI
jgi:alpha-beta hydrolase superfamily lysophospholipase